MSWKLFDLMAVGFNLGLAICMVTIFFLARANVSVVTMSLLPFARAGDRDYRIPHLDNHGDYHCMQNGKKMRMILFLTIISRTEKSD